MAIALGVHATASDNTSNATTTAGVTTQATGSTFVIAISYPDGETLTSVTDSKGNTYTAIDALDDVGNGFYVRTYYCENGVGGASHTATVTLGLTARKCIYFAEITGAKTSGALDQHSIVKDTSTAFDSAVTTTQANEIVLTFLRSSNVTTGTFVLNGGFAQVDANTTVTASVFGYQVVSATGTYSPAATCAAGTAAVVATMSFSAPVAGTASAGVVASSPQPIMTGFAA